MTLPGLVRANNLSDVENIESTWSNIGASIQASLPSQNLLSLLIHADGADGSTVIADSSPVPKTITASGNAQINTTITKFGTGSLFFDGSGDYVRVENDAALDLSSGDFTIDFWVRPNAVGGFIGLLGKRINSGLYAPINLALSGSNVVFYSSSAGSSWDIANAANIGSITINNWHHIALVRSKNLFYGFVNGTRVFITQSSANLMTNTSPVIIGGNTDANYLNGRMDEIRIVKGFAAYTQSFTPPTAPYSSDVINKTFSIVGRDIAALNEVRLTSPRDFIRIKGLLSPAQPRITIAANNTASGVARRDLAMPKLAPTTNGNYFFSSGLTLSGNTLRINNTTARTLSGTPFSGSTATCPVLVQELRPQAVWRITEPLTSGTIASPELAIPIETNDFVFYMKAGQN